jgi:hypothetical protein
MRKEKDHDKAEDLGRKSAYSGYDPHQAAFWPTLIGMLKNAYWEAIIKRLDHSIRYEADRVQRPGKKKTTKTPERLRVSAPDETSDV